MLKIERQKTYETKTKSKDSCCFSYSVFVSEISKGNKKCLLVLNNQSISDEEDDNTIQTTRSVTMKIKTLARKKALVKKIRMMKKKDDSFHFCNKKIRQTTFVKNFIAVQFLCISMGFSTS